MKRPRCLLVAGLLLAFAYGQTALAQQADRQDVKYWIFLKDKLDGAGKTMPVEAGYLSARALERRVRRGTAPSSTLDAPLSPVYLEALRRQGITPLVQSRWLNAVSARLDERQRDAVRKLPFVRELRPVAQARPSTVHEEEAAPAPLTPFAHRLTRLDYGNSETQLDAINAILPLERGINGDSVRIGFLDTNFDGFQHPVFAQAVNEGRVLADSNFTGLPPQGSRHARSVASIAVGFMEGELIGPAYGAQVIGATTEFTLSETNQEEDNWVAALEWMESEMGVDVVNSSVGYNEFDAGQQSYTTADLDGDTAITTRAADRAAALGVVVVTSAGNEGNDPWRLVLTPADGDSVIAVGAVTSGGVKVGFSSFGPTADGRFKPDVAAMGSGVYLVTSSGNFGTGSGTSFSSPLVAAVACQILQVNPDLNPIEVRDILRATASQAENPDNALGWGIIDADAAIARAEELATATEDEAPIPDAFEVLSPYPNPFSDQTVFEIRAPANAGFARMSIYNLLGQRVGVPFEGTLNPGVNQIVFQAATLPAGLYLYTLEGDRVSHAGKVILVR